MSFSSASSITDSATGNAADPMLGAFVAEYKPRRVSLIVNSVLGFLFALIGGFGIIYGLLYEELDPDARLPIIGISGVAFLIGWLLIEQFLRRRDLYVRVYQEGLISHRGGADDAIPWNDVDAVWQAVTRHYTNGVYTGTTHSYTLLTRDGKKRAFNDALKNVEALGNTAQQEVSRRILPRCLQQYNSGGTVNFGNVALSPQGITRGKETLPWSDIQGVELRKGYVAFKKQGKWFNWARIPVSSVPNMLVFLTMIDRIVGIKTT